MSRSVARSRTAVVILGAIMTMAILPSVAGCSAHHDESSAGPALVVPKPSQYTPASGEFELTSSSRIVVPSGNDEVRSNIGEYMAGVLRHSTGFDIPVVDGEEAASSDIVFTLDDFARASAESYDITVASSGVTVTAGAPVGLFRAVATLRQLFGPDIESPDAITSRVWTIVCAQITDTPAYSYRGLMLDIARHYFAPEVIMRQIDLAAQYKINTLHLHLSDDQGWRIEIVSRPALTEIGALGAVNGDPGGFLTQEDFVEIVNYAAARYIEVIPEIDMPGHVNAALVSIPELNPGGVPATPRTDIEVGYSTLQCRSEETYEFVDDVVREIAAISPSKHFHIGGDEANATSPEDYAYFVGRVADIVEKYGKTTIRWTPPELGEGIDVDSAVQIWDCVESGCRWATGKNLDIILTPAEAYLDQKYSPDTRLGLQWRGFISLQDAYDWYPSRMTPEGHLLGVEAVLWAETITTPDDMDYLLYPRLLATAEVGWTAEAARNLNDFMNRMSGQFARLDSLGVGYSTDYS